jgi:hypothetical protein
MSTSMHLPVRDVLLEIERRRFAPHTRRALIAVAFGQSYRGAAAGEGIRDFRGLHLKALSIPGLSKVHQTEQREGV